MNIDVSIPVRVGGYTGQRDQWEEFERHYSVCIPDGELVVLEDRSPGLGRKITFSLQELQTAIDFIKEQEAKASL